MKEIKLSDEEAKALIIMLKYIFKKYDVDLKPGNKGEIKLITDEVEEFILSYFTKRLRSDSLSIHLREKESNLGLMRLNIDPTGFHKNADGNII